jgi:uncharacterized membrane protein/Mg-chelatase subunit ChlD
MDPTQSTFPLILTHPWWLAAFALLPPLLVLGLWEGQTVRRRRVALGVVRADTERWRSRIVAGLRAAIISSVLLALAGLQIVQGAGPVSTVYVVDTSESVTAGQREAEHAYVQDALNAHTGDRAAVVLFGKTATVARALDASGPLAAFPPGPGGGTDLAGAIRLGQALLPPDGARRLVVISDSMDATGEAAQAAHEAGAAGVPVSVVPLHRAAEHEIAIAGVGVPATVPLAQQFDVTVRVNSTVAEGATLRVTDNGAVLADQEVQLQPGTNTFTFPVTERDQGYHSYQATIQAVDDRWAQNNAATGVAIVQTAPRVLIVAGGPDDGEPLRVALAAAHVDASVVTASEVPTTTNGLAVYDSIVLANVAASAMPDSALSAIQATVRDLGHGLIMIGGEASFGAGGYGNTPVEAALPVSMDVRANQRQADVALAVVVDKSGSMGRCHCGNSGAFRSTDTQESGVAKVDIAKQAILKAAASLAPTDQISVIAFDTQSHPIVQMQPLNRISDLGGQIAGMHADGDTNIYNGLRAGTDALTGATAKLKHMILLTDGWSEQSNYDEILKEIRANHITLSTISSGAGSSDLLEAMAHAGGGRYYDVEDDNNVPQLLLKDTVLATGSYFVETSTLALVGDPNAAILRGLDLKTPPALRGYNSTTPRNTADLLLAAPNGDPILAGWQYGLGRAVAWTPDMKGRWATDWVQWASFPQFATQMVGWTLSRAGGSGLEATASVDNGQATIAVDSRDNTGAPRPDAPTSIRVTGPDGSRAALDLIQTAPGHYEGRLPVAAPGGYRIEVQQAAPDGHPAVTSTLGLVVPYAAEYRLDEADLAPNPTPAGSGQAAGALAVAGGGQVLDLGAPAASPPAGPAAPSRVPLWPFLLTLALLLFPLDIALRRLTFGKLSFRRKPPPAGEGVP